MRHVTSNFYVFSNPRRMTALLALAVFTLCLRAASPPWKNGLPVDQDYFPIAVWLQNPSNAERFKAALIEGAKKNREEIELPFGE